MEFHLPSQTGLMDVQQKMDPRHNLQRTRTETQLNLLNLWSYSSCSQRWHSWLRHYATNRQVAGSIPDGVSFFIGIILSVVLWPWSRLSL
jgi:hypothetical protein